MLFRWTTKWLGLKQPVGQPSPAERSRTFRPSVEALEDRRLLSYSLTEFPLSPGHSGPEAIVDGLGPGLYAPPLSPFGTTSPVYFTESNKVGLSIGQMPPGGSITNNFDCASHPDIFSEGDRLTVGPDGNIWFSEWAPGQAIARLNVSSGKVDAFPLVAPVGTDAGPIISMTADLGGIWFAFSGRTGSTPKYFIERMDVTGTSTFTYTLDARPDCITVGSDRALWFTLPGRRQIGRIDASTGAIAYYATAGTPLGITQGPGGRLYFVEGLFDAHGAPTSTVIGWMDSGIASRGSAGYFPTSFHDSGFSIEPRITLGGDGALWFTDPENGKVGRMTTDGKLSEYYLGASTFPLGITAGAGHTIWFAEWGANRIGRLDDVFVAPWITDKAGGLSPDMVFASRHLPSAAHFILVGPGLGSTGAVASMTFTHDVSPTAHLTPQFVGLGGATLDPVVPSSPNVSLRASKVVTDRGNSAFAWEDWKQVFDMELPPIGLAAPHP